MGGHRDRTGETGPREEDPVQKAKRWFLPRDMKPVCASWSLLIICMLITEVGIISIISHLPKRKRSQRNRRRKLQLWDGGRVIGENERGPGTAFG